MAQKKMLLSVLILIIILRTIAHSTILCGGTLSALDPITAPEVTFIFRRERGDRC